MAEADWNYNCSWVEQVYDEKIHSDWFFEELSDFCSKKRWESEFAND